MSVRAALTQSSNRAAVRMMQDVGISRTVTYAKAMGIGEVPHVPSLALGSGEVTLESMTAAYAAFANRGLVPKPRFIRRVEDRSGQVLFAEEPSAARAISETTAFMMSSMLADVINAGTAARARSLGFTLPAAGKTGTTNEFHDAWFVGFTPSLVTGVWVGFDHPKPILPGGFASQVAVPMWAGFMKVATGSDKPAWLNAPPGLTTARVCRLSGQLARGACEAAHVLDEEGRTTNRSMVYSEYFRRGTEPTEECSVHQSRSFFGAIASLFTGEDPPPLPAPVVRPAVEVSAAGNGSTDAPETAMIRGEQPPQAIVIAPAPVKKRGFWSRIFGGGRRDETKERQSPTPPSRQRP
jgi:penicillin-binding protein 1A